NADARLKQPEEVVVTGPLNQGRIGGTEGRDHHLDVDAPPGGPCQGECAAPVGNEVWVLNADPFLGEADRKVMENLNGGWRLVGLDVSDMGRDPTARIQLGKGRIITERLAGHFRPIREKARLHLRADRAFQTRGDVPESREI